MIIQHTQAFAFQITKQRCHQGHWIHQKNSTPFRKHNTKSLRAQSELDFVRDLGTSVQPFFPQVLIVGLYLGTFQDIKNQKEINGKALENLRKIEEAIYGIKDDITELKKYWQRQSKQRAENSKQYLCCIKKIFKIEKSIKIFKKAERFF